MSSPRLREVVVLLTVDVTLQRVLPQLRLGRVKRRAEVAEVLQVLDCKNRTKFSSKAYNTKTHVYLLLPCAFEI